MLQLRIINQFISFILLFQRIGFIFLVTIVHGKLSVLFEKNKTEILTLSFLFISSLLVKKEIKFAYSSIICLTIYFVLLFKDTTLPIITAILTSINLITNIALLHYAENIEKKN
jgi:hypothetical protein